MESKELCTNFHQQKDAKITNRILFYFGGKSKKIDQIKQNILLPTSKNSMNVESLLVVVVHVVHGYKVALEHIAETTAEGQLAPV